MREDERSRRLKSKRMPADRHLLRCEKFGLSKLGSMSPVQSEGL